MPGVQRPVKGQWLMCDVTSSAAVAIAAERASWRHLSVGWVEVCITAPRKMRPHLDLERVAAILHFGSPLGTMDATEMSATQRRNHVEDVSGEAPMGSCSLIFHIAAR